MDVLWTVFAVKPGGYGRPVVFRGGGYTLGTISEAPAELDDRGLVNAMRAIRLLYGAEVCAFNIAA